jgi:hypothetical protein
MNGVIGIFVIAFGILLVIGNFAPKPAPRPTQVAAPSPVVPGDLRNCKTLVIRNVRFNVSHDYTGDSYYNAPAEITIYNPKDAQFVCRETSEKPVEQLK